MNCRDEVAAEDFFGPIEVFRGRWAIESRPRRLRAPDRDVAAIPPIPEVFVLWHPDCAHGHPIGWQIRRWLRPSAGQGPQVYYRSAPAPGGFSALPLPLSSDVKCSPTRLQVVIILLDHHLVADPAWRWWLEQLASQSAESGANVYFLPVALTRTAFNAPAAIAKQNFLRILDLTETDPESLWVEPLQSPLLGTLLKPITEALSRLILHEERIDYARGARPSAGVRLFISHAKTDGVGPASRLRDYLYSRTQLAAFFDENDIPYGDNFAQVLERALADGETAGLIAVVSDQYAARPWCRRELREFCRPELRLENGGTQVWALKPVLVVDALEGKEATRGLPEYAMAPIVRWRDDLPGSQQEELIITLLLREVFFNGYAFVVARHVAIEESEPRLVLSWKPDAASLLPIFQMRKDGLTDAVTVLYPGRELSAADGQALKEVFPHIELLSFTEADMRDAT